MKTYKRESNKIYFGSYYINNREEKEAIEWDILMEKNGNALIITHNIIENIAFDNVFGLNNYEKSSIRQWLNNDFYNTAFNDKEKNIIQLTLVDNSLSSLCYKKNKYICDDTEDNIFLLSRQEIDLFYSNKEEVYAKGTHYAKQKGLSTKNGNGNWWLRSPNGEDVCFVDVIRAKDYIYGIDFANRLYIGVRPVCWINLDEDENDNFMLYFSNEDKVLKEITRKPIENNKFERKGDTVTFGSYYNTYGKTHKPLKWDILKINGDGKALIITHDIIDAKAFNIDRSSNYEKSSIRQWLNNDFYNIAFNDAEKRKIQLTLVDNSAFSANIRENEYICNNTDDYIFLLSRQEVDSLHIDDSKLYAKGTHYAQKKGLLVDSKTRIGNWWLRSPGCRDECNACFIKGVGNNYGYIYQYEYVSFSSVGVRPACWINLNEDENDSVFDGKMQLN